MFLGRSLWIGALWIWFATPANAQPPAPSTGATPNASSLTNPAISVIGWFQAVSGNDPNTQANPFELPEAELGFQAQVDPFTRADFFMSAGPEGLEVEEGTITWLALPGGGQAKLGQFRADFGKFNRTHPPETPFADRPLAAAAFLGDEGLVTTGVSASVLLPNPMSLYWDAVLNLGTVPDPEESPLFAAAGRSDLLLVGRSSVFIPMGESVDLTAGGSYANARANDSLQTEGTRAQLGAIDLTLHWKNPRRSIYRSLIVQTELIQERGSGDGAPDRTGTMAYALYQFARQWKAGVRYDWTERPDAPGHETGLLGLVQFQPSEFSTLSVQARRIHDSVLDQDLDAMFFKWTFNIGPHGAHPY